MKQNLILISLILCNTSVYAKELKGKVGLGIGDDGEAKLSYFLSNKLSIKYGFYISDRDRDRVASSSHEKREFLAQSIGLRKYLSDPIPYSWFIDVDYINTRVTYSGITSNEDYDGNTYGLYGGFEYWLNDSISIDGRLGVEVYDKTYDSLNEDGHYFPTTNLSINYTFGT